MALATESIYRNLPAGWRFIPTEQQLLLCYLKPFLLGDPINGSDIVEINIRDYHPRDLFREFKSNSGDEVLYFFCPGEHHDNSKLRKRKCVDGRSWKCNGNRRPIKLEDTDEVIGTKRSLSYPHDGPTEFLKTEYVYTAPLDRPSKGNYVIYQVRKNNSKKGTSKNLKEDGKKKRSSKKKVIPKKVETDYKNTGPNKKARKAESSDCNSALASASGFQDSNLACGYGEQTIHMTSDLENQYLTTTYGKDDLGNQYLNTTYEKGESSNPKAFDFVNQNLCEMTSNPTSNKDVTTSLGIQTSYEATTISTPKRGERSCTVIFDLENVIPDQMNHISLNEKSKPSCQRASCVENQNSYYLPADSSNNKDEYSSLMDFDFDSAFHFDFENQNSVDMAIKCFSHEAKTNSLYPLDYEIQNPNRNMDISASMEGKQSPMTSLPPDFDYLDQYQKYVKHLDQCQQYVEHLGQCQQYVEHLDQQKYVEHLDQCQQYVEHLGQCQQCVEHLGQCQQCVEHLDQCQQYVEHLDQYQKIVADYCSRSNASKVGETTSKEVQTHDKIDIPILEDPGSVNASNIKEPAIAEGHSQYENIDMPDPVDNQSCLISSYVQGDAAFLVENSHCPGEMIANPISAMQQPIHTNESHNHSGFDSQSHHQKIDMPILDDNLGHLEASVVGESRDPVFDHQQNEELLAFWELEDTLNSQEQPVHTDESHNRCGTDTQNHHQKIDIPAPEDNLGHLADSVVGLSRDPVFDSQQLEELLAFCELEDTLNSRQQPIHSEESLDLSGSGTFISRS